MEIIFYKPSPGTDFSQCLLFGTDFFLLYSCFSGWELKLRPYLQYGVVYIHFFKAENQEIQFPLLCTKPSKDKQVFSSKDGSPRVDLSASRA